MWFRVILAFLLAPALALTHPNPSPPYVVIIKYFHHLGGLPVFDFIFDGQQPCRLLLLGEHWLGDSVGLPHLQEADIHGIKWIYIGYIMMCRCDWFHKRY